MKRYKAQMGEVILVFSKEEYEQHVVDVDLLIGCTRLLYTGHPEYGTDASAAIDRIEDER